MSIQNFGEKFNREKLFLARHRARKLAYELSSLIKPGMVEEDAHRLYKELSQKHEVEKQWHPPKLRFGPNTLKAFREPSAPYILQEEDIFFIDIGPVFDAHEADYGETFALGSQYEHKKICEASKALFNDVAQYFRETQVSGPALYNFAKERVKFYGYELNIKDADGHRIGDFPHHVFFKGALIECQEQVVPDAWILEIQLIGPERKFGAFFEDLLTTMNFQ